MSKRCARSPHTSGRFHLMSQHDAQTDKGQEDEPNLTDASSQEASDSHVETTPDGAGEEEADKDLDAPSDAQEDEVAPARDEVEASEML